MPSQFGHYGSYGGYHSSETVARGPEGNFYAAGHTTAYGTGGSAYHSGGYTYGDAQRNPGYSTGYHYVPITRARAWPRELQLRSLTSRAWDGSPEPSHSHSATG